MNQKASVEHELRINGLRDRGLSLFHNTREASAQLVDRTQRIAAEWLSESERRLLENVSELLRELDAKISERLARLSRGEPGAESEEAGSEAGAARVSGARAPARVSEAEPVYGRESDDSLLPLPGYDSLNAKAAISAIAELNGEMLEAIRLYEEATKNRATVLRAIEQRLAS